MTTTAAKKTYDYLYKILLIGESGVGKTCVLLRFADDSFTTNFVATIGIDFKIKTIDIQGRRVKLQIWDTAGQERFHSITTSYYNEAMGIMLIYDVTNSKSFQSLAKWMVNIDEHAGKCVERILVGNKCDLEDKRVISKEKGEAFARDYQIPFIETSAKANINVTRAFVDLTKAILMKGPINSAAQSPNINLDKTNSAASNSSNNNGSCPC